ncbi:MAG: hypothetical protein ABTQ31_02290 [Rhizobiaceae bacterium]
MAASADAEATMGGFENLRKKIASWLKGPGKEQRAEQGEMSAMSLHFFAIPACGPAAAEAELNHLLAANRVLAVERHFVANDEALFWAVCVPIASGHDPLPEALKADQGSARRVDYREAA